MPSSEVPKSLNFLDGIGFDPGNFPGTGRNSSVSFHGEIGPRRVRAHAGARGLVSSLPRRVRFAQGDAPAVPDEEP